MGPKSIFTPRLLLPLAFLSIVACVSPAPKNGLPPGGTVVESVQATGVVWTVAIPGVTAPASSTLEVQLRNAPNADPNFLLSTADFTLTADHCATTACTWDGNVDILHATGGIYTSVVDPNGTSSWTPAFTLSGSPNAVATSKANRQALTNLIAYSLPTQTLNTIIAATGVSQANAVSQGTVIVIAETGSASALTPQGGVSVTPGTPSSAQFFYFDTNFTTHTTTAQTNASGIFVIMGLTGNVVTVNVPVTLSGGAGTWAPATIEIVPGAVSVVGLLG